MTYFLKNRSRMAQDVLGAVLTLFCTAESSAYTYRRFAKASFSAVGSNISNFGPQTP